MEWESDAGKERKEETIEMREPDLSPPFVLFYEYITKQNKHNTLFL
jgi:hypothetical protein